MAQSNAITHLDLSNTECALDMVIVYKIELYLQNGILKIEFCLYYCKLICTRIIFLFKNNLDVWSTSSWMPSAPCCPKPIQDSFFSQVSMQNIICTVSQVVYYSLLCHVYIVQLSFPCKPLINSFFYYYYFFYYYSFITITIINYLLIWISKLSFPRFHLSFNWNLHVPLGKFVEAESSWMYLHKDECRRRKSLMYMGCELFVEACQLCHITSKISSFYFSHADKLLLLQILNMHASVCHWR